MIDLHSHILPGIDDGAKTLEDAVEMCRLAAADGTEVIVATPHRFDGVHTDLSVSELRERLEELREAVSGSIEVVLGCELHFTHDIVAQLCETKEAISINGGPYVLVEFPPLTVPVGCEKAIYQLRSAGFTPVIAHPERNRAIQEHPERFYNLMELGLLSQLDAGSLLGKFGTRAEAAAWLLLECRMVHAISSDAHSPRRRRPGISSAYEAVRDRIGDEVARNLVDANPRAIVEGRPIPYSPDPAVPKRSRSWWPF